MEASEPPTTPSPRSGPAPALTKRRRRLDSGGAPAAAYGMAAPALIPPSSEVPGRSSTTRKGIPPRPPAGPPLPRPKPAAKKKTVAPRAKKTAPLAAADRPPLSGPPPPRRQPASATNFAYGCAADNTLVDALDPFVEMPARDEAFKGVQSYVDIMDDSVAIDRINGLKGTGFYQTANMQIKPLSSSRALAASPPTQQVSRCRGLAVSRRGAGDPQRPGTRRSELEDLSTSAEEPGEVHASTGHADRRRPVKSSSLKPAPPASRRALATSTPLQAQPISPCPGVPAVSRRGVGDRRRSGTARSEMEASSTSAVERDEVHTSTGHSDQRRHPPKSSSLTPAPPSSRRGLVTSTQPQEQRISRYREVPAVSQRVAVDRQRPGMTRSEMEVSRTSTAECGDARTGTGHSDQLYQVEAVAATHSRSDVSPSADLADDFLVDGILSRLPDELLVEILSRLPAKPVHRFKCVSKSWRDLISDPHHHKRLPQALAGLFFRCWCPGEKGHEVKLQFVNMSARGPSLVNPALAFLPNHASIVVEDCCNGLLLLFSSYSQPRDYVVCNPATEKWVVLPNSGVTGEHWFSRLAFDPAISSHFHVLEYVDEVAYGKVGIFSTRTGGWTHSMQGFTTNILDSMHNTVFLNGMLHFSCHGEVRAIDLETKEWRHIQLPPEARLSDFFGLSQGCLVHSSADIDTLSFWTLQDYGCGAWSFKHCVSRLQVFGGDSPQEGAFHPECNTLFYPRWHEKGSSFMSYDFDRGELCHIVSPEFRHATDRVLPYVPFFGDIGI